MKRFDVIFLRPYLLLALTIAVPAGATNINFDAEATNRGGNLTGIPDSPLTIGVATFSGGELLNNEIGLNADSTGVYATEGLFGSGETNPLVINFASPVQDFSVVVLNGDDVRSYTVSDNTGESLTNSLASAGGLGAATFSLPGNGLTTVTIASGSSTAWDFAIDNVTFTATTPTPEPTPILLSVAGLVVLIIIRRKQLVGRRHSEQSCPEQRPHGSLS